MRYVKQNKIYTTEEIRQENPNMSIPADADCSSLGFEFLEEVEAPVQDGFYAVETAPVNNKQTWELREIAKVVPQSITKLQAMKQLQKIEKWTQLKAILAEPANEDINDEWILSNDLNRSYPLVAQMAAALELSENEVDNLFIEASKIL